MTAWFDDRDEWNAVVRRAFTNPDESALPGWEPLATTGARLLPAVRRTLDTHGDDDVVMVGHGTAWTLLVAQLTDRAPDLTRWRSLGMPDLITVPSAALR